MARQNVLYRTWLAGSETGNARHKLSAHELEPINIPQRGGYKKGFLAQYKIIDLRLFHLTQFALMVFASGEDKILDINGSVEIGED